MEINKIEEFRRLLRFLDREIIEKFKHCSIQCNISLAQCLALLEISYLGKTGISELAEILKLDKSTLSRTIESLVQAGLASREINPEDRRYMCVTLTEQGLAISRSINALCDQFYHATFSHIHEGKHAQIVESIRTLAEALQRTREEQDAILHLDLNEA